MRSFSTHTGKANTLVIGGAGYIGAHLVPMLQSSGRQVTVLGRKPKPMYALPEGSAYVQGDFGELDLLRILLDQHQEGIHLAYATMPICQGATLWTDEEHQPCVCVAVVDQPTEVGKIADRSGASCVGKMGRNHPKLPRLRGVWKKSGQCCPGKTVCF